MKKVSRRSANPPRWSRVAIVGVGLIGGSIGQALLARKLAGEVVGIGRRQETLDMASRVEAISSSTLSLERGVADADLVVVCTPVGQIAADVCSAAAHCRPGTLITDAGSTKAEIVARLQGSLPQEVEFVGSHPLAGGEKSGPGAARADLFVDRVVVVTPTDSTSPQALAAIEELWASLGAKVVRMTADEHDRQVAATSHLPHLAAAALAAATPHEFADLVARGWLDTTRVASGDPQLWTQIFLANRAHVLTTLARYGKVLSSFGEALERSDATALERILAEGKQARDALGS